MPSGLWHTISLVLAHNQFAFEKEASELQSEVSSLWR